jgi:hypothetical protein
MRRAVFAISTMLATGQLAIEPAAQVAAVETIEREAERLLASTTASFAPIANLADRLRPQVSNGARPAEERGRVTLLWVRTMRRAFAAIPVTIDATRQEPYRTWLAAHDDEVFYAAPAGEWKLRNERLWALHDEVRASSSAEPLAWEIVENGLGGECEGYPPCYLAGIDELDAEYLRRHPRGAHAAEAVARIAASHRQSVELATGRDRREFFNPATDCVDLVPKAAAVRAALVQAGVETKEAVALLDRLRALCP